MAARIVSVSDVYDALRGKRVYKAAMEHDDALVCMREENGTWFDPAVFHGFEQCLHSFAEIQKQYGDGQIAKEAGIQKFLMKPVAGKQYGLPCHYQRSCLNQLFDGVCR